MRNAGTGGLRVRPRGGGTKFEWGNPVDAADLEVSTGNLSSVVEHNRGDLTAVLQAGLTLADAQREFAEAGQMLALDPPLGDNDAASIGGIVATADSGPLRQRFGGVRDLLLGITVATSDGTLAKAGGKVIKNVAGYDLPKLFAGSFGTLGVIVDVTVRLHPRPKKVLSVVGESDDAASLQRAALALSHAPLEIYGLDLSWAGDAGSLVVALAGAAPELRAEAVERLMKEGGVPGRLEEHEEVWERQRGSQRSRDHTVVRVSAPQTDLARVIGGARRAGASLVARAGLGIFWLTFRCGDPDNAVSSVENLRRELQDAACVILDAPSEVREKVDVWGAHDGTTIKLMRRVKMRFDEKNVCNPGIFVGGI
jgi:glycolate oxidase FAD binding subunit